MLYNSRESEDLKSFIDSSYVENRRVEMTGKKYSSLNPGLISILDSVSKNIISHSPHNHIFALEALKKY